LQVFGRVEQAVEQAVRRKLAGSWQEVGRKFAANGSDKSMAISSSELAVDGAA
jgi:hypothetical protein